MTDKTKGLKKRVTSALYSRLKTVSPRMRRIQIVCAALAIILVVGIIANLGLLMQTYGKVSKTSQDYENCQIAARDLQDTSDYLTSCARHYVMSGELSFLEEYLDEVNVKDTRGKAIQTLRSHAQSSEAIKALEDANLHSNQLAQTEHKALRLAADAYGLADLPKELKNTSISKEDNSLSNEEKAKRAYDLVYGDAYNKKKFSIRENTQSCSELLVGSLRNELDQYNSRIDMLLFVLYVSVIVLLLVVLFEIFATNFLLLWPISLHEASIRDDEPLVPGGAKELRTLTDAYNYMYEKNHTKTASLQYEAHNDALTGLLNRGAYDELIFLHKRNSALILVDVDNFKQFNDEFGHEMGDAVLVEVAATLYASFRSSDYICRIGGDEFAVIMTNAHPELQEVIGHKIEKVAAFLRDTSNGLPSVSISVGIAFGDASSTDDGLFKQADEALYETKRRGRDGYTFFNDLKAAAK